MIELNVTLWIQLINFLVTLVVLNWLLVRPIRDVVIRRRETVTDLVKSAEVSAEKGAFLLDAYEAELLRARQQAGMFRKRIKLVAEHQEQVLLAEASEEAHSYVQARKVEINVQSNAAYASLNAELQSFTEAAVTKVLG